MFNKFLCCLFSLMIVCSLIPQKKAIASGYYNITDETTGTSYSEYQKKHASEKCPEIAIITRGVDYVSADCKFFIGDYGADGDMSENVLIIENSTAEMTYRIDVPENGNYCLDMRYFPIESNSPQIELAIKIDGEIPFDKASRLILKRIWTNESEIYTDSRGNQVHPSQIQKGRWQNSIIKDPDGVYNKPLMFYLEKGEHEITFSSERAEFSLDYFSFCNPEKLQPYTTPDLSPFDADIVRIEGESAIYKSDSILSPTYDNAHCMTSPADPVKVVYNTIGAGGTWKEALQSLTWNFDIAESGYYRIGIKARQNQMRGLYSNRRIYIDGVTPCAELEQVKFFYNNEWSITTPKTATDEEIYIYLEKGTHSIMLECVTGEIGEPLCRLETVIDNLNDYYRKILMITSPYPDKYTDYYVHEKIPDLTDKFAEISEELKNIQAEIETVSKGSEVSLLENTAVILDKCVKKPLRIPEYLSQIKENIISISAFMRDYCEQPLEIDYIEFAPYGKDFPPCDENILQSFSFGLKSFIGSFFEDYTTLSDIQDKEAVEVWVALGRDNAQVVRELTESKFMAEYNIPIAVNLISGGIIESALSGKEPDVALFLGGEFPINLASRGLLADISQYDGFSDVRTRFQENALTHFQYQGKTFGLPITQTFPMMFYRTDILSELAIKNPPETWSELMEILPAIQRNYMSVGLVLPSSDISPATESGHTFAMLMLQKGLTYYNDDFSDTVLDSVEAVQTFEQWTDFYTKYSFSQSYDAFTRFRTGEYPIVIANYSFAGQLETASPEINGLWEFCPVPATIQNNGSLSHAVNSNSTGAVIFNSSAKKEQAWDYIKWFTKADIQAQYGNRIESMLGAIGRYNTANIHAMEQLSWSENQLSRLKAQQSELAEIPILPTSYSVTRNIMNAFRETVNKGENPRDTLIWYDKSIKEDIRK